MISKIKHYLYSKITTDKKNIWKTLFLFRKVYLTKYYKHYFSQFGEDVVLMDWIPKKINDGFYVDVGCYHPRKFSNTYFLYKRGWRGINIDLDPLKVEAFNLLRPQDCNILAAVSDTEKMVKIYNDRLYSLGSTIDKKIAETDKSQNFKIVNEIQSATLNSIIEKTPYRKRQIDLLSVDVEGQDFNVLKSLNIDLYRPKLIIIESHHRDFEKIATSDIYTYLLKQGYKFVNWVGFSLFFTLPNNNILKSDFNLN